MTENDRLLAKLMKEAQTGDSSSYETLLSEVCMFLESYLNSKISDKLQIDDIVQEVLIAVHKSRHTFDPERSFFSWLLAITHYKINDFLRVKFREKTEELKDSTADAEDILSSLIAKQQAEILRGAISELDERPRQVITLTKLNGLSVQQTAEKLRISEANVKVIAFRATQFLGSRLKGRL